MIDVKDRNAGRKPRVKRAARASSGARIVFRVSDEEKARLDMAAGELSTSAYVRSRVFAGSVRNRNELRMIAELHVLGRRVRALGENPNAPSHLITTTLGTISAAIERVAAKLAKAEADENETI